LTGPDCFKTVANSEAIRAGQFQLFGAWPYSILIDREGKISQLILGSREENTFNYYKNLIDALLK